MWWTWWSSAPLMLFLLSHPCMISCMLETMQVSKGLDMHEQFQGLQASSSLHHNPLQSQTLEWECL